MLPAVYSSQRLNIMAWFVEGWHRRLNKKTDDEKPPFYLLVIRLYEEAQLLPIQRKLVSEEKL
jgi:hypothetical protein